MSATGTNRQIVVTQLPDGPLAEEHFTAGEAPIPEPGAGEVLCRTLLLSIDPANRAWMQGATYTAPVRQGDVMHGFTLAEVVASNVDDIAPGDIVESMNGWQEYAVQRGSTITRFEPRASLTNHMSVLGITGLTAYFGLLDIGQPKPGETVVVSAAAGAVGNVAGQIARIKGCRVVGLVGSEEKKAWIQGELGFDAAIDYKTEPVYKALMAACPDGIDVYFDNVGGEILGAALFQMNVGGRIPCCGVVSQYDTSTPAAGPRGVPGLLVTKRLRMEGFIVMDSFDRRDAATEELAGWIADGQLVVREDVIAGLDRAPAALVGLLHGDNIGKRMIEVARPGGSA